MHFELKQLNFSYSLQQFVFNSFMLSIPQGQALVLLGRNGCGKSTLLKLLGGLIFCQSGQITADQIELTAKAFQDRSFAKAYRQKVGFLFQNSDTQTFCSTVRDELEFGSLCLGLGKKVAQARSEAMIEMFQLGALLKRMPHQLSGGEKKKVALAAILTVNPDVLLLDEPTGGLDLKSQHELTAILQELVAAGKTLVTATHQLDLIPLIGERILLMEPGRILADVQPENLSNSQLQQAGLLGLDMELQFTKDYKQYQFSYTKETVR